MKIKAKTKIGELVTIIKIDFNFESDYDLAIVVDKEGNLRTYLTKNLTVIDEEYPPKENKG